MAIITVDGVRFGFDAAGDGPPVVFLHAALADRRMWEHQFAALAATNRVVRFDWRGYGESHDGLQGDLARYQDVLGVMDALGIEKAALVAPERIRALALICSGLPDFAWPSEAAAAMSAVIAELVPAQRIAAYRAGTADEIDPATVRADARAMAEFNVRHLVVGPGRSRSALAPEVWQSAVDMCTAMFEREWHRPPNDERFLQPPASTRLAEIAVPTLVTRRSRRSLTGWRAGFQARGWWRCLTQDICRRSSVRRRSRRSWGASCGRRDGSVTGAADR